MSTTAATAGVESAQQQSALSASGGKSRSLAEQWVCASKNCKTLSFLSSTRCRACGSARTPDCDVAFTWTCHCSTRKMHTLDSNAELSCKHCAAFVPESGAREALARLALAQVRASEKKVAASVTVAASQSVANVMKREAVPVSGALAPASVPVPRVDKQVQTRSEPVVVTAKVSLACVYVVCVGL